MTTTPETAAEVAVEQAEQAAATSRVVDGVTFPAPGTYVLDPTHTRIGFVARHLMVTKVRGNFGEFSGSITVAEDPKDSTAEATLKTVTIETGTPDRDTHLRSGDFLEAEKYPEITFRNARIQSQKDAQFTVVGDLTVKDTTRPVTLDVEIDGVATDPWGNEKLAITASTEIDREEFGMTWNVALETGGVLVSKKVKIEIEAQAARQA
ncbi:MAG: YceI family protein [Spirochaetaceae bacterium]|nr:YceI family protein [Spirochaetaceae bacterium]